MKEHLSNSIEFMRNREGLFLVLAGALFVQSPHTAEVFHRISTSRWHPAFAWLHSAGFAIVLELAVLLFVVRGRTKLSWAFAGISVLMNVFYYYTPRWWTYPAQEWALIVECIATSVALPLAIAFYSHEIVGKEDVQPVQKKTVQDAKPKQKAIVQDDAPIVQPDKLQRALQLKSEGLTNAQIGKEIGTNRNAVGVLLRNANGHSKEAAL